MNRQQFDNLMELDYKIQSLKNSIRDCDKIIDQIRNGNQVYAIEFHFKKADSPLSISHPDYLPGQQPLIGEVRSIKLVLEKQLEHYQNQFEKL